MEKRYKLFVDLDGVLVDFDGGVRKLFGRPSEEIEAKQMWPRLARTEDFYNQLDWLPDGKQLWEICKPLSPTILTGLPIGAWAEPQKRRWCERELGNSVPVITCMSRDKAKKAKEACPEGTIPVLIDDRQSLEPSFVAIGGIFILHTTAGTSINALRARGII